MLTALLARETSLAATELDAKLVEVAEKLTARAAGTSTVRALVTAQEATSALLLPPPLSRRPFADMGTASDRPPSFQSQATVRAVMRASPGGGTAPTLYLATAGDRTAPVAISGATWVLHHGGIKKAVPDAGGIAFATDPFGALFVARQKRHTTAHTPDAVERAVQNGVRLWFDMLRVPDAAVGGVAHVVLLVTATRTSPGYVCVYPACQVERSLSTGGHNRFTVMPARRTMMMPQSWDVPAAVATVSSVRTGRWSVDTRRFTRIEASLFHDPAAMLLVLVNPNWAYTGSIRSGRRMPVVLTPMVTRRLRAQLRYLADAVARIADNPAVRLRLQLVVAVGTEATTARVVWGSTQEEEVVDSTTAALRLAHGDEPVTTGTITMKLITGALPADDVCIESPFLPIHMVATQVTVDDYTQPVRGRGGLELGPGPGPDDEGAGAGAGAGVGAGAGAGADTEAPAVGVHVAPAQIPHPAARPRALALSCLSRLPVSGAAGATEATAPRTMDTVVTTGGQTVPLSRLPQVVVEAAVQVKKWTAHLTVGARLASNMHRGSKPVAAGGLV